MKGKQVVFSDYSGEAGKAFLFFESPPSIARITNCSEMLQTETGFRAIFRLTDITQSVIRSFGIPSHVVADPVFVLTG